MSDIKKAQVTVIFSSVALFYSNIKSQGEWGREGFILGITSQWEINNLNGFSETTSQNTTVQ